jgi:formate hydrogenlyase subunit 4
VNAASILATTALLLAAPVLPAVVLRIKAAVAGRRGPSLFQLYFDLAKLWRKGAVLSATSTVVFVAGTAVAALATLGAVLFVPVAWQKAPLAFPGDFLLVVGLLGVARVATLAAALDTGSSFEGMGASREALFSLFTEPALLLALGCWATLSGKRSLSEIVVSLEPNLWGGNGGALALLAGAMFVLLLAENSRVPFDDPATHLELTMIHEVMVLDHSGPLLASVEMASAWKLALFSSLLVQTTLPFAELSPLVRAASFAAGLLVVAVAVGIVESTMARLRLVKVPQFLLGALGMTVLSWLLLGN